MTRSDRDQRDAEQAARRANRLAERAEQRARRRAEQAQRAGERADELAARAGRNRDADERYAEDYEDTDSAARRRARRAAAGSRRATENATQSAGSRRRHRRSGSWRFRLRFNSGRGLYRDKSRRRVLGVCAGLAEYLDVEVRLVRLIAILGLIFASQITVPIYFIIYFLMDNKPYYRRMTDDYDDELDEADVDEPAPGRPAASRQRRSTRGVDPDMSNVDAFRTAREKFSDLEERLRTMETHVTSSRFELQRELRKISGEDA